MTDHATTNLASEGLGASVLDASDDFFASRENLVRDAAPIFLPDKYVATGKWMDGWESRRRRQPGHDWCIVRLGLRGRIRHIVVDTAHFKGNFPEACLVEGLDLPSAQATTAELAASSEWVELVPRSKLRGDHANTFDVPSLIPVTHLRLRIFPDGGVARLRALGEPLPNWDRLDFSGSLIDLASIACGTRVAAVSDRFFGAPENLLLPDTPRDMSDGWETRRRRGPGHDWVVLDLGHAGRISRVEVDTRHFKGNAPGSCRIDIADDPDGDPGASGDGLEWKELLPEARLLPHTVHTFADELADPGLATHVRLRIDPDGGVARLRLWGRTARAESAQIALGKKNALAPDVLEAELLACCGSVAWARAMVDAAPFCDAAQLFRAADRLWRARTRDDWLEAFAAHPQIGDNVGDKPAQPSANGGSTSARWSAREQAGVASASASVRDRLAARNREYSERFGYIYIVCAQGKSADEMLDIVEQRLQNSPDKELVIAADEQRKITRLRLEKWLIP